MRYEAKTFLRHEFASNAVDAISRGLHAHQGSLEALDELLLTVCHLRNLFFRLRSATLVRVLLCSRRIVYAIAVCVTQLVHHRVEIATGES